MKLREVNEFSQGQKPGTGRARDLAFLKIVFPPKQSKSDHIVGSS